MTLTRRLDPREVAPRVVVIGSSTGGPRALQELFSALTKPLQLTCPFFIAQHMPAGHTKDLAARLQQLTGVPVTEAVHGQEAHSGNMYVAPGDFHTTLKRTNDGRLLMLLDQRERRNYVRPAVDYLFETAAAALGSLVLGVVLTGMGSDGREGALAIKAGGGHILIQDKESCTVWGMPRAVFEADAYDEALDLRGLAGMLQRVACRPHVLVANQK